MANLFQPLDLTVNISAKAYIKQTFTEWYSTSISRKLGKGNKLMTVRSS